MVQVDQSLQDCFVVQIVRPAVSVEYGGVQVVVNLLQHRHDTLLVNRFIFRRQRFTGPQLFQHVVHASHRQLRMLFLLSLPMSVKLLGKIANAFLGGVVGGGKRERVEASRSRVSRTALQSSRSSVGDQFGSRIPPIHDIVR